MNYRITNFKSVEECMLNFYMKPDLGIMDYNLEGINGLETMKRLHKLNPKLPVIMLSRQVDIEIAANVLKAGASDYIQKNNEAVNKLISAIEKIIF